MQKAHSIKVLLVEDVEISRWLILESFRSWSQIIPDVAANGKEAVEKIQQNEYDIIFMDMHMPVMSGYEAAGIIRCLPEEKYRQVPLIALTGDSEAYFYTKTEASFFTDILPKPFDFNDLMRKILQHVPAAAHSPDVAKPAKVEKLFKGNKKREEIFYREAHETLQSFKSTYTAAMHDHDVEKLSALKHKALLVMHVLALEELQTALEKSQELLKKDASPCEIKQAIAEGEACFDQAIEIVQAYLKQYET